jgi:hypothetical protein
MLLCRQSQDCYILECYVLEGNPRNILECYILVGNHRNIPECCIFAGNPENILQCDTLQAFPGTCHRHFQEHAKEQYFERNSRNILDDRKQMLMLKAANSTSLKEALVVVIKPTTCSYRPLQKSS